MPLVHRFGRSHSLAFATILGGLLLLAPLLAAPAIANRDRDQRGRVSTQIVGGTAVPDGKYPFITALLDTSRGTTVFEQQFCGGSLIDPSHVLTAAHCVKGMPIADLEVVVGRTVLSADDGQFRDVTQVAISPLYKGNKNDAAVLTLFPSVNDITPARVATAADNALEAVGQPLTVAGWGNRIKQPANSGAGIRYPDRMREVTVPVVGDRPCDRKYDGAVSIAVELCAGTPGKDSCQGDSGGPLFHEATNEVVQIGIVSYGLGCGASFPGVYAEVNSPPIVGFIQDATGG